ncbi:hypothetical protein [Paenibacillus popilliae]|uniref:Permease n=1 Tax=Paenibacillus popilliae ATCC 14706 TaxID=1212764 RepID=M9LPC5_PAEPP|nr:hypothetical protein [Paenibacillus popilliae]GAC42361.1 permease [Paenibacillus popilliae ATCC 14706]
MTKQELVKAWKNPKLRAAGIIHPAGDALVEVNAEELARVHGGQVAMVTPTPTIVATTIIVSGIFCSPLVRNESA